MQRSNVTYSNHSTFTERVEGKWEKYLTEVTLQKAFLQ